MPERFFDTIAAVSTPPGEGGVGIIRISGPDALKAALKVFHLKRAIPSASKDKSVKERYLHYGTIAEPESGAANGGNTPIDDGFLVYMKAPRTYTGLDVVELHCHGGVLVLKKVFAALSKSGCRLAGAGEFTRQAFLNGRLDLTQAEAVIDVIRAETDAALSSARGRLEGAFSRRVNAIKETLAGALAHIEATLDFPEGDIPPEDAAAQSSGNGGYTPIREKLAEAQGLLKALISTYQEGAALKNGVRVLILGRPNVGKSSLLNILLQEERAIVTPVPGTTRDVIEEAVVVRGVPIRLIDTAGLRDTLDPVESIGVRLARERVKDAELILYVVDVNADTSPDRELLRITEGKKLIVVVNKTDTATKERLAEVEGCFKGGNTPAGKRLVFISAQTGLGVGGLEDAIYELSVGHPVGHHLDAASSRALGELTVTLRHKESLDSALECVTRAQAALDQKLSGEFAATDLRQALDRLGEITGETATEDILDRIFSAFCIGK